MSGPDDYRPPSFWGMAIVAIGSLVVIAALILILSNALNACDPGECPPPASSPGGSILPGY